jgi:hypothetical protein
MEEMMDETLDGLDEDQDELEEEADAEVDKVLYDLTDGKLGVLNGKAGSSLPVRSSHTYHLFARPSFSLHERYLLLTRSFAAQFDLAFCLLFFPSSSLSIHRL